MENTAASLKVGDQVHCLSEQVATLGRASDNTIVLDDDSVSSHHAEIFMRDGVYCVRDLGSTNGTTLSGVPVIEVELKSEDILSFGTIEAVFLVVSEMQESSNSEVQSSADQPNDLPGPNHLSLGDKIKQFGQVAWAETKRSSHLFSLKAKIEKLTRIDLRQSFHDLGKTCYESKIGEEKFSSHFQAIRLLQERIAEGRKGVHAAEDAKTMEILKAVAQDQAGKITSEALSVKLGSLFVELGKAGESQGRDLMPKEPLDFIDKVQEQIVFLQTNVANASFNGSPSVLSLSGLASSHRRLLIGLVIGVLSVVVLGWLVMRSLPVVSHTSNLTKVTQSTNSGANNSGLNPGIFLESLTLKTKLRETTIPSVLILSSGYHGGDPLLDMDIRLSGKSQEDISQRLLHGINLKYSKDRTPEFTFERDVVDSFEIWRPSDDLLLASNLLVRWAMSRRIEDLREAHKGFFDDAAFLNMLNLKKIDKVTVGLRDATRSFCANTRALFGCHIAKEFVILGRLGPNLYEVKHRYMEKRFILKTRDTTFERSGLARIAVENCGMTSTKTTDGFKKEVRLLEERRASPTEEIDRLMEEQKRVQIELLSLLRDSKVSLDEVGRTINELKMLCDEASPQIGNYNVNWGTTYVDNPPGLNYSRNTLLYCILALSRNH